MRGTQIVVVSGAVVAVISLVLVGFDSVATTRRLADHTAKFAELQSEIAALRGQLSRDEVHADSAAFDTLNVRRIILTERLTLVDAGSEQPVGMLRFDSKTRETRFTIGRPDGPAITLGIGESGLNDQAFLRILDRPENTAIGLFANPSESAFTIVGPKHTEAMFGVWLDKISDPKLLIWNTAGKPIK